MKMKRYNYDQHWQGNKDGSGGYSEEYEKYWSNRCRAGHNAKMIVAVVNHYGPQIFEKSLKTLSNFLRTPLYMLEKVLEVVDSNLTDGAEAKLIQQPIPIEGRIVELLDTPKLTKEQQKKWLSDTDIDRYLR